MARSDVAQASLQQAVGSPINPEKPPASTLLAAGTWKRAPTVVRYRGYRICECVGVLDGV